MSETWQSLLMHAQIGARGCFRRLERLDRRLQERLGRESERRCREMAHRESLSFVDRARDKDVCSVIEELFGTPFSPFDKRASYLHQAEPSAYLYEDYAPFASELPEAMGPADLGSDLLLSRAEIGPDPRPSLQAIEEDGSFWMPRDLPDAGPQR